MVYLFIGQDSLSKDIQLNKLKEETLAKELQDFNLDTLYARELSLKGLQEKLLSLPVKSRKRIIIIKDAQSLKEEIKMFILESAKQPPQHIVLVLDIMHFDRKDEFINRLSRHAKTFRFREAVPIDTFTLIRQINMRKPDYALRVLNQLFDEGERPERILGGLRYAWEKESASPLETKKRLKLLLNCDIEIKTGRVKPVFALEKLVVNLCGGGSRP